MTAPKIRSQLNPLQEAKQQLVRDAISNAALDLFFAQGFEATTVDDIAKAAGVSRRSFFRYFSSKSDLLAQQMTAYGHLLAKAIAAAPRTYSPREVVRDAVLRIASMVASYPRARQSIQVTLASKGAREAYLSRRGEVEDQVAGAFMIRLKSAAADTTPSLLAGMMLSVMDVTLKVWFDEGGPEISPIAERVIANLHSLVCGGVSMLGNRQVPRSRKTKG